MTTCTCNATSLPAGGAGGAAAGSDHVFPPWNVKAGQVQEVSDHLTFNGYIQRRVGMEAAPQTERLSDPVWNHGLDFFVCLLPWRYVDLQDPGFKVLVQHDVEAEELVAAVRSPNVHLQQSVDVRFGAENQHKREFRARFRNSLILWIKINL